jgi:hypothetical protein
VREKITLYIILANKPIKVMCYLSQNYHNMSITGGVNPSNLQLATQEMLPTKYP